MSVILFTGGGTCVAKEGCVWGRGTCMVRGHVWEMGTCMARGACVVKGVHGKRGGMHGRELGGRHACRKGGHWSGWYASCWNAFLLLQFLPVTHPLFVQNCSVICMVKLIILHSVAIDLKVIIAPQPQSGCTPP